MESSSVIANRRRARQSLAVFACALVVFSALAEGLVFRTGRSLTEISPLYVAALMWSPFLASLVARLVLREGFADVSFRWGGALGWRCVGIALAYPLLIGSCVYGTAWTSGLASFSEPVASRLGWMPWSAGRFLIRLLVNGGLGTLVGVLFAAGEELGWRGYLLVRMRDAGLARPVLIGGLVWGLWHVPLILTGQYEVGANIAVSVPCFCLGVVAEAYLFGFLRLRSGSVWPAVVAHAAYNAVIQGVFDHSTVDRSIWVGEGGLLTAVAELAVTVWLLQDRFVPQRRSEAREPELQMLRL